MAGNLKEVRERISSVKGTQQITRAMKMVSAAKLRKAQMAITKMRPYALKLNEMLRNILSNLEGDATTTYGIERPVENACVVIVTSNRGLAGAFNSNIQKAAIKLIAEKYQNVRDKGNLTILPIGKKGRDFFKKRYLDVTYIEDYVEIFDDLTFENVAQVSKQLMEALKTIPLMR